MANDLFLWQDFNGSVVQSNMDNVFKQINITFMKKTLVDVFKLFFFLAKRDPVHRTFYDGSVQLINHSSL